MLTYILPNIHNTCNNIPHDIVRFDVLAGSKRGETLTNTTVLKSQDSTLFGAQKSCEIHLVEDRPYMCTPQNFSFDHLSFV